MAIPDQLQQIDQSLIRLLAERISILSHLGVPPIQDQLSAYRPLLMQTGVSETAWSSVVINSMAALASGSQSQQTVEPKQVTVVGGRGVMGCFFAERLATAGHHVNILEYDDWGQAKALLSHADIVLICVPLKATASIIRRVAPYLKPTTVLADIASTKTAIVETMMDSHVGPVLGLHPMFGPGVKSFLGQKVVVCPGRCPDDSQWFLDLIEADGGQLIFSTPEEHDRMMIVIQAVRFFSNFSLSAFLAEEGVNIERSIEFASPMYRSEINTMSRLVAQEASLYVDILLASEERSEAISRLVKTYDRLAKLLAEGDRTALIAEFEATRQIFRSDATRAFQESNHTINTLSTFLAAHEVEATQLTLAGVLS